MNELKFDENLAIREVLDDIVAMVDRREKLIRSADQQAEKYRNEQMAQHVQKLEGLMADFLTLFEPILAKVRKYGENLRESISESEKFLKSLVGIIDAGKNVEGGSATLQELEKDAQGVQEDLQMSSEALGKIETLFRRTRQYVSKNRDSKSTSPDLELEGILDSSPPVKTRRTRRSAKPRVSRSYLLTGPSLLSDESSKS